MTLRREAISFAGLRCQVQRQDLTGLRRDERVEQFRYEQMRDHRREPGSRAEHHPVRVEYRLDRFRDGRRVVRDEVYGLHLTGGQCHRRLAAHRVHGVRAGRVVAPYERLELQRHGGHGQHPAVRAEELADQVQGLDMVAELLPEGDDQQIADRVLVQIALGLEAVLDDLCPGLAPVVVTAECGERLAEVAGRQDAELLTEPAAGAAVVGDGDHGGEIAGDPAQRGERRGQAHAAAECDDLGLGATLAGGERGGGSAQPPQAQIAAGHSRPMSRWTRTVSIPSAASRAASFSDIATERCLPPVQPTAIVT